jgi:hypothetical protein
MTTKKFRLGRRAVLRGAGTIAIGLPWLECMEDEVKAQAAPSTAQRFIGVFQPGGTVIDKWRPTGTEDAPVFGTILAPLEPVKDKLVVVDGLEMKSAIGEQHQCGMIAFLTGAVQGTAQKYSASKPGAENASLDQVIASKISRGVKPMSSLEVAVRWATGKSHGLLSPINALNFEDTAVKAAMPPRLEPSEIWTSLFGSLMPATPAMDQALLRRRSILDFVDRRYVALAARMGAADRAKLEDHLDKIRQIENGLKDTTTPISSACLPPTLIDTSDYNAKSGLNSSDDGSVKDTQTDKAIPKVGALMMDMLVMGLACERTAVATLQWSDSEAKHTFPWLGLSEHHHYYQHDGGFNAPACEKIAIWYSQMHLHLIQSLAAVDMGGHTLLDESVVLFGSEISEPATHKKQNMPFLLAGNGGGLRTGRYLKYPGGSHNDLLVSVLNLFGDTRTTFGNPQYCGGPLKGPTLT